MGKARTTSAMLKEYRTKVLTDFVVGHLESAEWKEWFGSLEPKDKIDTVIKMMKYVYPTLQAVAVESGGMAEGVSEKFAKVIEMSEKLGGK